MLKFATAVIFVVVLYLTGDTVIINDFIKAVEITSGIISDTTILDFGEEVRND